MTTISELPQETLLEILSRVPAKSVGKCRCVSKPWRTILSTPQFIRWHLNRQQQQNNNPMILTIPSRSIPRTVRHDAVSRNIIILQLPGVGKRTAILGSCAGLVLFVNEKKGDELVVVNPITLRHTNVPDLRAPCMSRMYGFGYDASVHDHKIVSVSCYIQSVSPPRIAMTVGVYSLKRGGVWKILEKNSTTRYKTGVIPSRVDPGPCLNGAIHWLTFGQSFKHRQITAFDLAREVFTHIPLPGEQGPKLDTCLHNQLVVLGGCLCVLDAHQNDVPTPTIHVWIMKEYGFVESWTKLCAIDIGDHYGIFRVLCFVGDDDQEIALLTTKGTLVSYNVKMGSLRDMMINVDGVFNDGVAFVPSLVSPFPSPSVS